MVDRAIVGIPESSYNPEMDLESNELHIWTNKHVPETITGTLSKDFQRKILSRYLHCHPSVLPVSYQDSGKPFIADSSFTYNVSHSCGRFVLVVGKETPLGVDIEKIRPILLYEKIAKRLFPESWHSELSRTPDKEYAFICLWTKFESLKKAKGEPLFIKRGEEPNSLQAQTPWQHMRIPRLDDYIGWITVKKNVYRLSFFEIE